MTASSAVEASVVWTQLGLPLPLASIKWRQDGKPVASGGKFFARFVPYIDQQTVIERLDASAPGWTFSVDTVPEDMLPAVTRGGETLIFVKGRLTITLPDARVVWRDGVGSGKDAKAAATDALKRAAVLYGIGRELYSMGQLWVPMDGDGKYAKPLRAPSTVWAEKVGAKTPEEPAPDKPYVSKGEEPIGRFPDRPASDQPPCPKCGGQMYDNRKSKRNPKAPDFRCKDRSCDGVIWPPRDAPPPAPDDDDDQGESDDEIPW